MHPPLNTVPLALSGASGMAYGLRLLECLLAADLNVYLLVSQAMVVCPCSMGTLAAIAHGLSDNLIERAADVMLKEQKKLILVPREAPFSTLHLENMLALSRMNAVILPANPGFYHRPQSVEDIVDFIVARILDQLGIQHALMARWGDDR